MKITITTIIMVLIFSCLAAENMIFRMTTTGTGYYPEYTEYKYDSPVTGVRLSVELYNLLEKIGFGASGMFQLENYDHRIDLTRFYDVYIHNFYNSKNKNKYFIYGFYGGIRYSKLEYEHYRTHNNTNLTMSRPLLGFLFASESWGFDVNWSQAENRKPILGYELKFRNSAGIIFQIGRRNRGPMVGADSDFYIYAGYEFFM